VNNNKKIIYWFPRILSFLFIIFLSVFSLDVFSQELDFFQTLIGLFIHNIPTLIALVFLAVSWKYELFGGGAFILMGVYFKTYTSSPFLIFGPPILIGILFFMNWGTRKNHK